MFSSVGLFYLENMNQSTLGEGCKTQVGEELISAGQTQSRESGTESKLIFSVQKYDPTLVQRSYSMFTAPTHSRTDSPTVHINMIH